MTVIQTTKRQKQYGINNRMQHRPHIPCNTWQAVQSVEAKAGVIDDGGAIHLHATHHYLLIIHVTEKNNTKGPRPLMLLQP